MATLPTAVGRYRIVRLLGRGGMGMVYLARDPNLNRDVAVKVLSDRLEGDELRARFEREARAAGSLRHPNIVTIFDINEQDGQPYIVMEYLPGETLQELIRRKAPLKAARKIQIMEEVCAGLGHAHDAGVVHRDVKPSNVLVDHSGVVKILDFGIAKFGETVFTQPGAMPGTINYMAPELFLEGAIDYRADIFAVGAVFYELLTGAQAFPGTLSDGVIRRICREHPPALAEACPDLDREVDEVVARALAKRPEDRFPNLAAMRTRLEKIRRRLEVSKLTAVRVKPEPARPANEAETVLAVEPVLPGVPKVAATPPPEVPTPQVKATWSPKVEPVIVRPASARVFLAVVVVLVVSLVAMGTLPGWLRTDSPMTSTSAPPVGPPFASGDRNTSPVDRREMVVIPPGEFQMGSPAAESYRGDDEALHEARVESSFLMDVNEVTNADYRAFVIAVPKWQKSDSTGSYLSDWSGNEFRAGTANNPVTYVSWYAANAYCIWAQKRLPTEAEWEYAARAGTQTPYWWGAQIQSDRVYLNGNERRSAVGNPAHVNPFGLGDILGNALEWTSTLYRPYPYRAADGREDPASGGDRVFRGATFLNPSGARAAARFHDTPRAVYANLGFRCAK